MVINKVIDQYSGTVIQAKQFIFAKRNRKIVG